ncbi:hypothetical protein RJ641_007329 [Dillenia turbinata]|uniref:Uncharacterized protein n=1 Tax=Dillenia turbinata TaxID=194707 RepID=A0AAN8V178_9MAGN
MAEAAATCLQLLLETLYICGMLQLVLSELVTIDDEICPVTNLDRFIPKRSAIYFGYDHYMLTGGGKSRENPVPTSPSREQHRNLTRILAFKNKPSSPAKAISQEISYFHVQSKPVKPRRHISLTSERTLDASDLMDDYNLNLHG